MDDMKGRGMGRFKVTGNDRRFTAGIMAMMLLFAMLFSVFFLSAEVGHECNHNDCPICACMQQCSNTIHSISDSFVAVSAAIIPIIYFISFAKSDVFNIKAETLVSQKVRLDN